jgi:hypothetical protein
MGCIAVTDQAILLAGPLHRQLSGDFCKSEATTSGQGSNSERGASTISTELTVTQLDKKFPAFYENLRLFTRFPPLDFFLSHIKISLIPVLSVHLILSPSTCLFPSGFPSKILHALRFYFVYGTCSVQFIFLDLIILTKLGDQYKL